jgi:hypothetical protein
MRFSSSGPLRLAVAIQFENQDELFNRCH